MSCNLNSIEHGALACFVGNPLEWLDGHCPGKQIGRNVPTLWHRISPELNSLNYFVWGIIKQKIYATTLT